MRRRARWRARDDAPDGAPPPSGSAKCHSRPSRDDGVERQDFFRRRRPAALGARPLTEAPTMLCCAALRAAPAPIVFATAQHARTHAIDPCCARALHPSLRVQERR